MNEARTGETEENTLLFLCVILQALRPHPVRYTAKSGLPSGLRLLRTLVSCSCGLFAVCVCAIADQSTRENILTLKCPRCGAAFVDFEGCMALNCAVCGVGFCGWCLADCGRDAHEHVARYLDLLSPI
jgi:hypothetical protein